ncbi:MAG TPA: hypothetical protein VD907_00170 [Verrucomicrobiae bacterium]|nr:hypothetical protein [Verrucomicrobiae bacterium]
MAKIGRTTALRTATVFLNAPGVLGVDVIGSVARGQKGNDLDLVVVVTPVTYATYVLRLRENVPSDAYDNNLYFDLKATRLLIALQVLGFGTVHYGWLLAATKGVMPDVHLMPEKWQTQAEAIQQHLPHHDSEFVKNIAGDAVTLAIHEKEPQLGMRLLEARWP